MLQDVDIAQLKLEFEEKIRQGRLFELRQKLRALNSKNLPREDYALFANFARRVGSPNWALKLLRPIVRMDPELQRLQPAATGGEIASYSLALAASGALIEAQLLTQSIEHLNMPATLQACAYVSVWNWDYKRAIPFFKRYLTLPQLSHFQKTLAQINLARAHAFLGHWLKVQELLDMILPAAKEMKWNLIERDALLVRAEAEIREEKWDLADTALDSALHISKSAGFDILDVMKWQAVSKLGQTPDETRFNDLILPVLEKARNQNRWEIARDLDFISAKLLQKSDTLNHVYFGTPFPHFRKYMMQECRDFWRPSPQYTWSPLGADGSITLDLMSGSILGQDLPPLSKGSGLNLMRLFVSDFYRPFKRGCILEKIYPDRHYDVKNMAHNISNLMSLFRKSIHEHRLPLEIHYEKKCYQLKLLEPMSFLIQDTARAPYDDRAQEQEAIKERLARMRKKWPYQTFTAKQAAELLDLPINEIRKLMQNPLAENQLLHVGETRSRRYRFQGRKESKATRKAA